MKPRRVVVTIEFESCAPIALLRDPSYWGIGKEETTQVQVNVIRPRKKDLRKKK